MQILPHRLGVCLGILQLFAATAIFAADEVVEIASLTLTDEQLLKGQAEAGVPVVLTGTLNVPTGEGPFPAMILLHGSDGPRSASSWSWSRALNGWGMATLRVDSYTARGFSEIYSGQGRVGEFNNVVDAYRAVDVLASDPRIDALRIGLMGFSRGGIGALYASLDRFGEAYGPKKARIAAFFPFYPPCNFRLDRELEIGPEPIRAFHGEADTWNPLPVCRDYLDRLKAAGNDVALATFPGAHHSFDHTGAPSYNEVSDAQTSRACFRREEGGLLVNAQTNQPFSWTDACVEMGPAVHYKPDAATAAQHALRAFLRDRFSLP